MTGVMIDVQIEQIDIQEIRVEIEALSDQDREALIDCVLDELSDVLGVNLRDPAAATRAFTMVLGGDNGLDDENLREF